MFNLMSHWLPMYYIVCNLKFKTVEQGQLSWYIEPEMLIASVSCLELMTLGEL